MRTHASFTTTPTCKGCLLKKHAGDKTSSQCIKPILLTPRSTLRSTPQGLRGPIAPQTVVKYALSRAPSIKDLPSDLRPHETKIQISPI